MKPVSGLRADRLVPRYGDDAVDDGAILFDDHGRVRWLGAAAAHPEAAALPRHAGTLAPGLIDAHTHAAWVGSRHDEYLLKMAGADYRAIAARGGGIKASARATAEADGPAIAATLRARLQRMAALGVTTVEVKSGYGLLPEEEEKVLAAISSVAAEPDLPRVVPTFLALHAIPAAWADDRAGYVAAMAATVDRVAARGHARFVDAYIDGNAFTVHEGRTIFTRARAAGLGVRMHIGQFEDVGGAHLAAEFHAASVDHVEHLDDAGRAALAAAGCRAVLLPTASFVLRQEPPDVAALRAARLPMIVASDANPGTAPTESLPLALALAVRLYGLTAEEALRGATVEAARSLGLPDGGALAVGAPGDVALWDGHEHTLLQPFGTPRAQLVLRDGVAIAGPLAGARNVL